MRIPRTNITVWPFLNILQTRANNETGTVPLMLWGKQLGSLEVAIITGGTLQLAERYNWRNVTTGVPPLQLAEHGGMGTYFACQACKSAQYFYSISQDIRIFCELRVGEEEYHTMANTANRVGGGALLVAPDRVRKGLRRGTVCP